MPWQEFKQLMSGLSYETPLGRIIAIRSEDDAEILKHFSADQHRIRNEWLSRRGTGKTKEETDLFLEQMKKMFIDMAGGGKSA